MTTGPRHSLQVPMPPHESILSDGVHRGDDRPASRWPMVAVALFAVLAAVVWGFATLGAGEVEDQKNAAVEQVRDLGREVTQACAKGDVVQNADGQDLCRRAAEAQTAPVPAAATGAPGRPPTTQEISDAVEAYCAVRAGCAGRAPTTAEVTAAVAAYLTANPPQPGRPPTAAEIAEQVTAYFAANPPPQGPEGERGPRGEVGPTGERGPGPTEEEIEAAVAAHLAANPPPSCRAGTHLETVEFADGQLGLACVFDDQPDPDPTTEPPEPTTAVAPTPEPDPEGQLGG